jgi:hypothetical protein
LDRIRTLSRITSGPPAASFKRGGPAQQALQLHIFFSAHSVLNNIFQPTRRVPLAKPLNSNSALSLESAANVNGIKLLENRLYTAKFPSYNYKMLYLLYVIILILQLTHQLPQKALLW